MNYKTRTEKIRKLRREGLTYKEIGDKFGVTNERIRQLLRPILLDLYCRRHSRRYPRNAGCFKCLIDVNYFNLTLQELLEENNKLIAQSRTKELVYRRRKVIQLLYEKYDYSLNSISKLMKRDISTIKYLYATK